MKRGKLIAIFIIIIALAIASYFAFFFTKTCKDKQCFNEALVKCNRAKFLNDAEDASWLYLIRSERNDKCKVDVRLLQLKQGTEELSDLENKEMACFLPLGTVTIPEKNLGRCHGMLKEGMQDVIIKRLHSYIVDNLGEIEQELQSPL